MKTAVQTDNVSAYARIGLARVGLSSFVYLLQRNCPSMYGAKNTNETLAEAMVAYTQGMQHRMTPGMIEAEEKVLKVVPEWNPCDGR